MLHFGWQQCGRILLVGEGWHGVGIAMRKLLKRRHKNKIKTMINEEKKERGKIKCRVEERESLNLIAKAERVR